MVDFSDNKYHISKQDIDNYINNDYECYPYTNKQHSKIKQEFIEKINSIYEECDLDNSKELDNLNEVSLFNEKINNLSIEGFKEALPFMKLENGEENHTVTYHLVNFFQSIFDDNNNQERIEYIGNFSYNNDHSLSNDAELLDTYDKYYKENSFMFDKEKQNALQKLRDMIFKNEIVFEDGLNDNEIKNLFNMTTKKISSITNKNIDTQILKDFINKDAMVVEKILNGDFSAFDELKDKSWINFNDLYIVYDLYKLEKGDSFYNELVKSYEDNKISDDEFIKNMKTILKAYSNTSVDKTRRDRDKLNSQIQKIYSDICDNKIDLIKIKNFNFDEYVNKTFDIIKERLNTEVNDLGAYIKYETNFDLEISPIASILPEITNNMIDENTCIQKFNDKEYNIKFNSNCIEVKDDLNREFIFDYSKIIAEDKEDKDILIDKIRKLPAPVLIDLAISENDIYIIHDSSSKVIGNSSDGIQLNFSSDHEKLPLLLAHELAHVVYWSDKSGTYEQEIDNINKAKYSTLDNEYEYLADAYSLIYLGRSIDNNSAFAECSLESLNKIKNCIEISRKSLINEYAKK